MMSVFEEAGNPFQEDTADLFCVDTRRVASANVVKTVMTIQTSGLKQYHDLLKNDW